MTKHPDRFYYRRQLSPYYKGTKFWWWNHQDYCNSNVLYCRDQRLTFNTRQEYLKSYLIGNWNQQQWGQFWKVKKVEFVQHVFEMALDFLDF